MKYCCSFYWFWKFLSLKFQDISWYLNVLSYLLSAWWFYYFPLYNEYCRNICLYQCICNQLCIFDWNSYTLNLYRKTQKNSDLFYRIFCWNFDVRCFFAFVMRNGRGVLIYKLYGIVCFMMNFAWIYYWKNNQLESLPHANHKRASTFICTDELGRRYGT